MRILLFALCIVAAGLYVKILLPPDFSLPDWADWGESLLQAEGTQAPTGEGRLREVPESQMQVIRNVFAPELAPSE